MPSVKLVQVISEIANGKAIHQPLRVLAMWPPIGLATFSVGNAIFSVPFEKSIRDCACASKEVCVYAPFPHRIPTMAHRSSARIRLVAH